MTAITIPNTATPPIAQKQFIRNSRSPAAELQNMLAERMGYAAAVKPRMLASFGGALWSGGASSVAGSLVGTRKRWRFQFHSDSYCQFLRVHFVLARQDDAAAADCNVRMRVYSDAAMSTCVAQAKHHYGASSSVPTDAPSEFGSAIVRLTDPDDGLPVDLTPDTDYWVEFEDVNYARMVSACVWEVPLPPDTDNGYASTNHSAGSPVLDSDRAKLADMGRNLHRRGGPILWCYSSNTDATARVHTNASATYRNVIDDTSTTVGVTTPGVTLNLVSHATMRQQATTGVPVRMWVYCANIEDDNGEIRLLDSTGATMLSVVCDAAATGWVEATGYLPATLAKYDLHYGGNTEGSLAVYAVTLYEYEHGALEMQAAGAATGDVRIRAFDATSSLV
jgi:hypothetical protein